VGGVKYFAQRVVSFDDGVQVIACRRRVFPGGVTKEDLQVGAFIRSGDLFAVGLTQFDNGSQAMVVEGFRFPNLGLPRDEVLRRADPTCQDFDPLDP
jgi:hypothetical protein